jgi:hypothetical protein
VKSCGKVSIDLKNFLVLFLKPYLFSGNFSKFVESHGGRERNTVGVLVVILYNQQEAG